MQSRKKREGTQREGKRWEEVGFFFKMTGKGQGGMGKCRQGWEMKICICRRKEQAFLWNVF